MKNKTVNLVLKRSNEMQNSGTEAMNQRADREPVLKIGAGTHQKPFGTRASGRALIAAAILFGGLGLSPKFAQARELSADEIRERLELRVDVYMTDPSGTKLLAGPESTNYWLPDRETGELRGDWSSNLGSSGIGFHYAWHVNDDRSLRVSLEEFGNGGKSGAPDFKNALEKKEFVIHDFEPLVWRVKNIKSQNYVVRFIPSLRELSKPLNVESLPVSGDQVTITDNAGYLWAEGLGFKGKYVGVTTHRGSLFLSYSPLKNGQEIGIAEGDTITVRVDKKFQIKVRSATGFLPAGVTAKVYALYLPSKKSKSFNSVYSFSSGTEARIEDAQK